MTLFGLVLAIGLLVDDAIVVVENVERLLEENPDMTPKEATIQSMGEIQVALVAIAVVLSAVFLPMAFFGGSTGVIYRQFSITIVSAMVLSALVALILSPALTATLLRQKRHSADEQESRLQRTWPRGAEALAKAQSWFNTTFARGTDKYVVAVGRVVDRKWLFLAIYAIVLVLLAVLFVRLPTGFLPTEDQGSVRLQYRLPAGATLGRTREVQLAIEKYMLEDERKNIAVMFSVAGGGQGAAGQNTGQGFVNFVDWSKRKGRREFCDGISERANKAFGGFRDAQVNVLVPAAIRGLGQTNGFSLQLQNASGMSREEFVAARDKLLAGGGRSRPCRCAPRRAARCADLAGRYRPAQARCPGAESGGCERHPVGRVGRALC